MKINRLNKLRWQTFGLLLFQVLGSTLTLANLRSDAESEMPDIKGALEPVNQKDSDAKPSNVTVDKVNQAEPTVSESTKPKPLSYILEGTADSRELTRLYHLQSSDVAAMFEVVETLFQGKVRRISADRRTNTLIVVALPIVLDEIEAIVLNLDTSPTRQRPTDAKSTSLPNTTAAKELVERLETQESVAASAANEIRRLQANGGSGETIAPHQVQLNSTLQTAFELKMQLEELQVKELQSRLSRLERQIGQRKELREKIISRRVTELLNPDVSWDTKTTTQPASARDLSETSDNRSQDSLSKHGTIQQQIAELLAKRRELSARMVNEHPAIKGLDQKIATLRTAMSDESNIPVTVIYLKNAKARTAVDLIQQHYPKNMGAFVADDWTNSVHVRGDEKFVRDVQQLIKGLDAEGTSSIPADKNSPEKATTGSPSDSSDSSPIIGASAPGIEAIAIGLDSSAAAIKNMSVRTDYKKLQAYGLPFDAPMLFQLVTKTIIDSEGRLRVETTGQQINIEPDGKSARAYNGRWETVFQNGEARSLTWYESNPPTASIDNTPTLHGIHPREFTTHFQSKPVSEIIRTSAAEITERIMWDDRPVTIVQTSPIKNSSDSRRYRFWIDLERKAVVRRAISIRFAEGQPWQEYARIENHDYQEIAPGIWLPIKVKYESLDVTPELASEKLSWSYEGTNRDWKVNSELPADTFELAFPEGTFVNDHRAPGIQALAATADMKSLQEREMKSLQGTWCFDVLQSKAWPKPIGMPTDSSGRKSEQRWVINGDRITWTSPDGELIDVRFTIDPTKTPKQIEFSFLSGPQKGMKSIGIYEAQKGNANYLWLCMTNPGTTAPRPTEVGYSSEKQQSMIGIYPVEKLNTPPVAESLKRFQGDWQISLCDSTLEGFGSSQEEVKKWTWTIRSDEILWSRNGEEWKLKLDVDSSKSPSEFDLTYLTGPHEGSKCLGMFQWGGVDKTQLMIAIQDPGSDAPRPKQFSMSSNTKTGLMILEPRRTDLK